MKKHAGVFVVMRPEVRDHVADAVDGVGAVIHFGGPDNYGWREKSVGHHLWHAVKHIFRHAIGDTSEPHLLHTATRTLFALQLAIESKHPCAWPCWLKSARRAYAKAWLERRYGISK